MKWLCKCWRKIIEHDDYANPISNRWPTLILGALLVYCFFWTPSFLGPHEMDLSACGLRGGKSRFDLVARVLDINQPYADVTLEYGEAKIFPLTDKVYLVHFSDRILVSANSKFSISRLGERTAVATMRGTACLFELGKQRRGRPPIIVTPEKPAVWTEHALSQDITT
jgi:hypothetical protein